MYLGAQIDCYNEEGLSILGISISKGKVGEACLKELIQCGCNVNHQDQFGSRPVSKHIYFHGNLVVDIHTSCILLHKKEIWKQQ